MKDALAATTAFPGVTRAIIIDADRNAQKAVVILTVKGAPVRYAAAVKP